MDTIQINNFLKESGFNDTETKIISELAYSPGYSIGDIIKKTGFHRGTTYNILQRLKDKGVLGISRKFNGRKPDYKYVLDPNAFLSKILAEKSKIKEKENFAKEFIKSIKNLPKFQEKSEESKFVIFYGRNAYKNFIISHDLEVGKNEQSYFYIGEPGTTLDYISKDFETFHMGLKKKFGIVSKSIMLNNKKDHDFFKIVKNARIKWSKKELQINPLHIRKDSLTMVNFDVKPYKIIYIKDKDIVKFNRELFKYLWDSEAVFQEEEIYQ